MDGCVCVCVCVFAGSGGPRQLSEESGGGTEGVHTPARCSGTSPPPHEDAPGAAHDRPPVFNTYPHE